MKGSESGSARFAALVKAVGRPHAVTLWTRPEDDPEFMRAVRDERVVTITQSNVGQRKDYGEVGFIQKPGTAYLVFPKSLKGFEGKRIVGINYDLLDEAPPRGPIARAPAVARKVTPKKEKPPPQPRPDPRFVVTLQHTATATTTVEVTAKNAEAAKKMASKQAEDAPFDLSQATIRTRVVAAKKAKTNL
jgi:hypothetical protein